MPTYRVGDMWDVLDDVDYFLITTNSTLRKDGALVMGAGIARQCRDAYPGVDKQMGRAVSEICSSGGFYGVILGTKLGMFQVKYHWASKADLNLITASTILLHETARANPHKTFALNFPGIGNGGLPVEQVKPIVDTLPENIQIWSLK